MKLLQRKPIGKDRQVSVHISQDCLIIEKEEEKKGDLNVLSTDF